MNSSKFDEYVELQNIINQQIEMNVILNIPILHDEHLKNRQLLKKLRTELTSSELYMIHLHEKLDRIENLFKLFNEAINRLDDEDDQD